LFFILSGYLIYDHLLRSSRLRYGAFLMRRARRIYPAYVPVFIFYALFFSAEAEKIPPGVFSHAQYLVECFFMLPGGIMPHVDPLIGPAWTLSYELAFYLLVPWVIVVLGLRTASVNRRIGTILLFMACLIGHAYYFREHERPLMLLAGMLVRELVLKWPNFGSRWYAQALAVAGAIAAAGFIIITRDQLVFTNPAQRDIFIGTCVLAVGYGPLVLCCLTGGTLIRRTLEVGALVWLGEISYSFYLVHNLPLRAAVRFLPVFPIAPVFWLLAIPLFLAPAIGIAYLLYSTVEHRFLAASRAKQRRVDPALAQPNPS
jgi:peptidoglycan/LPS O-acetylase OafA/YrhL